MGRQINRPQMEEQEDSPEEELNEMETNDLSDTEFRVMIIKMLNSMKKEIETIKRTSQSLAGVAQWTECWTSNQRVAGSIPSQGTCLSCRPGPQYGVCERQPRIDGSLPLFKNK